MPEFRRNAALSLVSSEMPGRYDQKSYSRLLYVVLSITHSMFSFHQALAPEERQYYEREADKQNGMNPIEKDEGDDDDDDKRGAPDYMQHMQADMQQQYMHPMAGIPAQHDPRYAAAYQAHQMGYGQAPYQHYEAQGHPAQAYHQQRRSHGGYQGYPPQRHPYDNSGMGM